MILFSKTTLIYAINTNNQNRCEAFNKVMQMYNVHSNKKASSRDIAMKFAKIEQLRLIASEGTSGRYIPLVESAA